MYKKSIYLYELGKIGTQLDLDTKTIEKSWKVFHNLHNMWKEIPLNETSSSLCVSIVNCEKSLKTW